MKIIFTAKEVSAINGFSAKISSVAKKTAEKMCIILGKDPKFAKAKVKEFVDNDTVSVDEKKSGDVVINISEGWTVGFFDKFGEVVHAWIDVGFTAMVTCLPLLKIAVTKQKEFLAHTDKLTKED